MVNGGTPFRKPPNEVSRAFINPLDSTFDSNFAAYVRPHIRYGSWTAF